MTLKRKGWRAALAKGGAVAVLLAAAPFAQAGEPIAPRALPALGLAGAMPVDADLDHPFEYPLPARIKQANGETTLIDLRHCRDWLQQPRAQVVGSDNEAGWQVLRMQGVRCDAMALLRLARPAARTALPARFADQLATALYPASLALAPSRDERARWAKPGSTLAQATGRARWQLGSQAIAQSSPAALAKPALREPTLVLRPKGSLLQLTLLARGDFDHDGWEDAAFLWQGAATRGTLVDTRLVVLTRTRSAAGPLLRELAVGALQPGPGR